MVIFLTGEGAPLHHKRYESTGEEVEYRLKTWASLLTMEFNISIGVFILT